MDEERKEPKKPTTSSVNDADWAKAEAELEKEKSFILHLMYMSREVGLTNDPKQLYTMYKEMKEKARMGVVWSKGDADAEKVI